MKCLANKRFPCGHCYACRFNRMREKAMRINHELQYHKDNCFVTLTYRPEEHPANHSLQKRDVQLFLKRLRKRLGVDRIRYFVCGEYGDSGIYDGLGHPHYHMIIFGLSCVDNRVFKNLRYFPQSDMYYADCDVWDKGFVSVGKITPARVDYVAKYCFKKLNGDVADVIYKGRQPEFSLSSKNPGLGFQYAKEHEPRLKADDFCRVRGKQVPIPRYYVDKLWSHTDKFKRSSKRDDFLKGLCEKVTNEMIKQGKFTYKEQSQYVQDKIDLAKQIIAKRMQRKGKTKCPIE